MNLFLIMNVTWSFDSSIRPRRNLNSLLTERVLKILSNFREFRNHHTNIH